MLVGSASVGTRQQMRNSPECIFRSRSAPTTNQWRFCGPQFAGIHSGDKPSVETVEFFMTLIHGFKIIIDVNSNRNCWLGWCRHQDTGTSVLGSQQLAARSSGQGLCRGGCGRGREYRVRWTLRRQPELWMCWNLTICLWFCCHTLVISRYTHPRTDLMTQ